MYVQFHGLWSRRRLPAASIALCLWALPTQAAEGPRLFIEPIPGLTTTRHLAPDSIAVPIGTALRLVHELPKLDGENGTDLEPPDGDPTASAPGDVIRWIGASESERTTQTSHAELVLDQEGDFTVVAAVTDAGGSTIRHAIQVRSINVSMDRIALRKAVPVVEERPLSEGSTNAETMQAFFGESIAPLVPVGVARDSRSRGGKPALSRFRTSINRTIRFDLRTDPPGFESLMEVRAAGIGAYLPESDPKYFVVPGTHAVSVGPPRAAREFEIETYEVFITSHIRGVDRIRDGEAITFSAVTNPPGFEDEIRWVASTKFGSAHPVSGRGPTFTTRFEDTVGSMEGSTDRPMQWLGVKAANAILGQDAEFHGCSCSGSETCEGAADDDIFVGLSCVAAAPPACRFLGTLVDPNTGEVVFILCTVDCTNPQVCTPLITPNPPPANRVKLSCSCQ